MLVSIAPSPPTTGPATVAATLRGPDGAPLGGATVRFEGTMSHAGMAPVEAQARETAPGQYEAPLEFTMAGEWIIIVRASLPDGRTLERPVTIGDVRQNT
ncbi:MAG TPA: FixH family protein [Roseiflexaceae bacterium]|nr:FixH family protein [Roseiflexaceae bacterium]